jgi:hypothetical protein
MVTKRPMKKSNRKSIAVFVATPNSVVVPPEYKGREGYYLSLYKQAQARLDSWAAERKKPKKQGT